MRLAASACSPSGSAPGSARTCEHANRGEHPLFACSLLCPAEKTEPRRVPRRIATFWWQPTHAARAETACGLCRARRRKTSVAKLKAPKPSACRFSREQPPARVERAQQEQDYAASLSGHAGCRLFFLRCKRECGGCTSCTLPLAANDPGPMPCPSDPAEETAPAADQIEKASNPPSTTASAPVTNDEASLTR